MNRDRYRIGVLSDTHLPGSGDAMAFLGDLYDRHFSGIDMILHAGDVVAPEVLAVFADCPVHAVRGNMDPATSGIPVKQVVACGNMRIGLIHGWGPAEGLEARVLGEFRDCKIDCLVFGHSHRPVCRRESGILLFNPGSPTDRRRMAYHSVGLLEIAAGQIHGRIIAID